MNRRRFLSDLAAFSALAAYSSPAGANVRLFPISSDHDPVTSASMWIYLWDLVDEGYDTVLRRLKESGLTSISLATAYHAGKFLEPHNPKHAVVFPEDGTISFTPHPEFYGRITPIVHSLVREGHDVRRVRQRADAFGLRTRSWVVCCHNTPLGTRYPDIAMETAFGDRLPQNLCPSNPDVRAYLRALVRDIASYGVEEIELEAAQFQGYAHGFHHEREGIALTVATRFLLGFCFCPACVRSARDQNVDLAPIRSFTQRTLKNLFENPDSVNETYGTLDALPTDLFEPAFAWRAGVVASLVEELAHAAPHVRLWPMTSLDPVAQRSVGMDPRRVAPVAGGMLALGYVKDGAALRSPLHTLQQQIGRAPLTVGVQVGLPESGGKTEFLSRMSAARELGVTSFNFYNYGFIPLERLGWITESVHG